jgi:hypothetical protein
MDTNWEKDNTRQGLKHHFGTLVKPILGRISVLSIGTTSSTGAGLGTRSVI